MMAKLRELLVRAFRVHTTHEVFGSASYSCGLFSVSRDFESLRVCLCFHQVEHDEQLVSIGELLRTVKDAGFDGAIISVMHKTGNQVGHNS